MNDTSAKKILIIQTAFIGDSILASSFAYEVKKMYPHASIHFLVRQGNESLSNGINFINKVWVWNKTQGKIRNLIKLAYGLRREKFDVCFNLHRHFASGFLTVASQAKMRIGFKENPLSFFYHRKIKHLIPNMKNNLAWHEVQRNAELLSMLDPRYIVAKNPKLLRPHLPIQEKHLERVKDYTNEPYVVIAPASVWFTKQWPVEQYKDLVLQLKNKIKVYLIGAPSDFELCENIRSDASEVINLCGKLSLLESASLMKNANRVIVNDSGPLHLASCMNAKTTAIFCSTIKEFGYFTLSDDSVVLETPKKLECRPCGLHGKNACPLGHFECGFGVSVESVLKTISL